MHGEYSGQGEPIEPYVGEPYKCSSAFPLKKPDCLQTDVYRNPGFLKCAEEVK